MTPPFFLMLYGYPGTGKYTVAQEVASHSGARLIDNHLINNPIFQVMRTDGNTAFSEDTWSYVGKIRELVFDCIARLANPKDSFIFTNVLVEETKENGDRLLLEKIQQMAENKHAAFIPVKLECELSAAQVRIANQDREIKTKLTCPKGLAEIYENYTLLNVDHLNALTLNTARISAMETAKAILVHIAHCQ